MTVNYLLGEFNNLYFEKSGYAVYISGGLRDVQSCH